ncbi:hypothetical protein HPP92_009888 [Vanilla planifolia]|uniref:Uncharacterized protein n=1 Tax=Vanilla planifolia TaxID=51239 RepID=A0A835QZV9_VANPL|nr:hypothetical protein HPP92_009888 [Vanilla planifolia]
MRVHVDSLNRIIEFSSSRNSTRPAVTYPEIPATPTSCRSAMPTLAQDICGVLGRLVKAEKTAAELASRRSL